MEIGLEIRQKEFKSSLQKATINILYTSNWLRDQQTELFKQFDLQPQHYNILRILKGKHPEPVSPGDIREVMLDKGVDLTRLVDKLVKQGYVNRETCPSNRRKVDLTLTKAGLKVLQDIQPELDLNNNKLKKHLTENEAEQLSNLLDKLRG